MPPQNLEPYLDGFRTLLNPAYSHASDSEVFNLFLDTLEGLQPEEIDGLWRSLRSGFRKTARIARQVAPSAAPLAGMAVGAAVGGPVGGAVGQQIGARLGQQLNGGPRRPGQGTARQPNPAAAQLLGVLNNPRVQAALASLLTGKAGRKTIPLPAGQGRSVQVPPAAILNLISHLAQLAARETVPPPAANGAGISYLQDEAGQWIADPTDPLQRTEVLLNYLALDYQDRSVREEAEDELEEFYETTYEWVPRNSVDELDEWADDLLEDWTVQGY